jgi:hypothetical protein
MNERKPSAPKVPIITCALEPPSDGKLVLYSDGEGGNAS